MSGDFGRVPFDKMTGSGNDFVVFTPAAGNFERLETKETITALCARGTGVGADGVVFLEPSGVDSIRMRYYNADGSRASLCGNASLCSVRLAVELGLVSHREFALETDAGRLVARMREGVPEIELEPVDIVQPEVAAIQRNGSEQRLGYAVVGVPHVIVRVPDLETIDLSGRGSLLRHHPSLVDGANVNFVSKPSGRWSYRTYERGVEGETLACGSGAVAIAILLATWEEGGRKTVLMTRSGKPLTVTLRQEGSSWYPTLGGEGRLVFSGIIRELR